MSEVRSVADGHVASSSTHKQQNTPHTQEHKLKLSELYCLMYLTTSKQWALKACLTREERGREGGKGGGYTWIVLTQTLRNVLAMDTDTIYTANLAL